MAMSNEQLAQFIAAMTQQNQPFYRIWETSPLTGDLAQDISKWFENFEYQANLVTGITNDIRLVELKKSLRDRALSAYQGATAIQSDTYAHSKMFLNNTLSNPHQVAILRQQFHNRKKQENESVADYLRDLRNLVNKAYASEGENARDLVLKERFISGLMVTEKTHPNYKLCKVAYLNLGKPLLDVTTAVTTAELNQKMFSLTPAVGATLSPTPSASVGNNSLQAIVHQNFVRKNENVKVGSLRQSNKNNSQMNNSNNDSRNLQQGNNCNFQQGSSSNFQQYNSNSGNNLQCQYCGVHYHSADVCYKFAQALEIFMNNQEQNIPCCEHCGKSGHMRYDCWLYQKAQFRLNQEPISLVDEEQNSDQNLNQDQNQMQSQSNSNQNSNQNSRNQNFQNNRSQNQDNRFQNQNQGSQNQSRNRNSDSNSNSRCQNSSKNSNRKNQNQQTEAAAMEDEEGDYCSDFYSEPFDSYTEGYQGEFALFEKENTLQKSDSNNASFEESNLSPTENAEEQSIIEYCEDFKDYSRSSNSLGMCNEKKESILEKCNEEKESIAECNPCIKCSLKSMSPFFEISQCFESVNRALMQENMQENSKENMQEDSKKNVQENSKEESSQQETNNKKQENNLAFLQLITVFCIIMSTFCVLQSIRVFTKIPESFHKNLHFTWQSVSNDSNQDCIYKNSFPGQPLASNQEDQLQPPSDSCFSPTFRLSTPDDFQCPTTPATDHDHQELPKSRSKVQLSQESDQSASTSVNGFNQSKRGRTKKRSIYQDKNSQTSNVTNYDQSVFDDQYGGIYHDYQPVNDYQSATHQTDQLIDYHHRKKKAAKSKDTDTKSTVDVADKDKEGATIGTSRFQNPGVCDIASLI